MTCNNLKGYLARFLGSEGSIVTQASCRSTQSPPPYGVFKVAFVPQLAEVKCMEV